MDDEQKMKPIVILPLEAMSKDDIEQLRANGICVVECDDPESVRFIEPPPGGYDKCERAAIELFRVLMRSKSWNVNRSTLAEMWADCLLKGTPLESVPPTKQAKS